MQDLINSTVKHQSVKAMKWMTSAEVGTRLLQFGVSIVLARLLGPSVFGVFGVCLIFFRLVGALGDLGFSTVIIQKEDLTGKMIGSAATLSLLFSCMLCMGLYLSASYAYYFFPYEGLEDVLRAFSFVFILEGLCIILRSIFIRELRFKALTVVQLLALVMGSGISLLLAFHGMGVWSLIVGLYTEIGLQVLLFMILSRRTIRPQIDGVSTKENIQFALKILLTRAAYFLNANLGALLVGKFLGEYALGLYVVAYGLMDAPVQRISKNIGIVSFTTLSKFQKDTQEFQKVYGTINHYFSLFVFAVFIGLFIVSQEFVVSFYGTAWQGMVIPLRVLCFAGIFRSLLVISSSSLVALNKVEMEIGISLGQALLMLILVLLLLQFGTAGACFGVACAHGLGYLASLFVLASKFKQTRTECFIHLYHSAVPSGVMVLISGLIWLLFKDSFTNLTFLIANIAACGTGFVLTVFWMDGTFFTQARKFLFVWS